MATLIRFEDVTESSGVDFTYRNGQEAGHFSIVESLGGGAALFDNDRDGDLDIFLPGGGTFGPGPTIAGLPPALFNNLGDWKFRDITVAAGAECNPHYSHGPAAADFNNDGFTDVLVTGYGGVLLLLNQGDGTYTTATAEAGLTDELWSSSAAWGDFDSDGNLDLYVTHYVNWSFANHPQCGGSPERRDVCPPRDFEPLPDYLYLNNGDGTFREASESAGLVTSGESGKGLGVLAADLDLDGHTDIYVGNDTVPNFLYRNRGDGTFDDASLFSGTSLSDTGVPDGSMGVDVGDFNLDGLPDIWVANYELESFGLYRNEGNCFFRQVSSSTGVTAVGGLSVGWGTVFADFDLDGDEDVFASNGHVIRHTTSAPLLQEPLMFQNEAGNRLVNVARDVGSYFRTAHMGRGAAAGDIDNDGDTDLVVARTNAPFSLLENTLTSGHRSIQVQLIGRDSNRDAIGASVRLESPDGVQLRQVKGGTSYASTHDRRILFGLGDKTDAVEIRIQWPSGQVESFSSNQQDEVAICVEGRGVAAQSGHTR